MDPKICILETATQVQTVPDTDERVELRGQKSLVALRDLAPGEIIGLYTQYILRGNEVDKTLLPFFDDYSFGLDSLYPIPARFQAQASEEETQGFYNLVGTGLPPWGNATRLINDCRLHPWAPVSSKKAEAAEVAKRANCVFILTKYQNIYTVHVESRRPVKAGEELLINYGRKFWDNKLHEKAQVSKTARFEVEKILDHRKYQGALQYLTKWVNHEEPEWNQVQGFSPDDSHILKYHSHKPEAAILWHKHWIKHYKQLTKDSSA